MLLVAIHHWLLNLLIGHQSDFRTFVHADTCRNNGYAQLVIHIRVKRSTDNHSRVVGSKCTDGVTYRFELIQTQVEARVMLTSTPRAPDRSISSAAEKR